MIEKLTARPILDSRGEWTLEVSLTGGGHQAIASVPQGESQGSREVITLPAETAVRNISEVIAPALVGSEIGSQNDFDARLKELDGTITKKHLGGNALLGVSIAHVRLLALIGKMPLWQFLRNISRFSSVYTTPPQLLALVLEGGLHAAGGSPFQEYLVLPKATTVNESVSVVTTLYRALRRVVGESFDAAATRLGDEGAYAPLISDPFVPLALIMEAAKTADLADQFTVGLDAAANNVSLDPKELIAVYDQMRKNYPLQYLEDPFGENDLEHFTALLNKYHREISIVGDDLTTTNTERMKLAQEKKSLNAMIVKPNQIGTVTETLAAVELARQYDWKVIVSHRGRETNDDFIADLAWGIAADGIKLGAPARGERVAKYNRLLEIEATGK